MSTRATTKSRAIKRAALFAAVAIASASVPIAASAASVPNAAAKPKQGGDISVGIFDQVLTTCYTPNVPNSALGVLKSVMEGLVEKKEDGTFTPFLAESFSNSADYKTWTIKLRPGIKYSNGEDLNAANVVLNLNALAGNLYLAASAKKSTAYDHTAGSGIPFTANLKTVTAVDAMTVQMDLWTPQVDWLDTLYASGRNFMRSNSTINSKDECVGGAVGTGPFKFEKVSATEVKVVRNPNYWRKDASGTQLPYLNSITFKYVEQPTQRLNGLKTGSLDAAQFTSAGEVKQIVSVRDSKNLKSIDSSDDFYPTFWLNQGIEPFNNKNARMAFAHAWDAATYYKLRNCFKGKCVGSIPSSVVGPKNVMYNKQGYLKTDIKKSKQFQAAYKTETGKDLSVELNATMSAESLANAKAVQQILKKAGITATINQEDGATQVAKAFPGAASAAAGKLNPYQAYPVLLFEGTGTGFILPFISPNVFKEPGNLSTTVKTPLLAAVGMALNVTRHADTALATQVWDAKADITSARNTKLKAVTKYLQENAVVVPTPTLAYTFGFSSKIQGFSKFKLASGGLGIPMTNAGINWTGVYVTK